MSASCSKRLYANTVWHRGRAAARLRRTVILHIVSTDARTTSHDRAMAVGTVTAPGRRKNAQWKRKIRSFTRETRNTARTTTTRNHERRTRTMHCCCRRRMCGAAGTAVVAIVGQRRRRSSRRLATAANGLSAAALAWRGETGRGARVHGVLAECGYGAVEEKRGARLPGEGNGGGGGTAATSGGPISRYFSFISFSVTFLNEPNFHGKHRRQFDDNGFMAFLQDYFFNESTALDSAVTTLVFHTVTREAIFLCGVRYPSSTQMSANYDGQLSYSWSVQ